MKDKKCDHCGKDVENRIECIPNFAAPPLDVCEECADILTTFADYHIKEEDESA